MQISGEMYNRNSNDTRPFFNLGAFRALQTDFNLEKVVSKIYIHHGSCTLQPVDFNMDLDSFDNGFKQLSDCTK